jgi:gamma-polyglutamate biosynthesis protein CapA
VKLSFIGDVMLGRSVQQTIDCYGYNYILSSVGHCFNEEAFIIANLEAPFCISGEKYINKDTHLTFGIEPQYIEMLHHIRVKAVTLANNHSSDYGLKGINDTIRNLDFAGIQHTGAGTDIRNASKPIFVKEKEIAILSFNLFTPFSKSAKKKKYGALSFTKYAVRSSIEVVMKEYKAIILVLHWGIDYHEYPVPCQVRKLKKIIDEYSCIIAVICHHPHLLQPTIYHRSIPIVCSIGNFLFDEPFKLSRIGTVLDINIENYKVSDIDLKFTKLDDDFRVIPLPYEEDVAEKQRLYSVLQNMKDNATNYNTMDSKWFNILVLDFIVNKSLDSLKMLFYLYNLREITYNFVLIFVSLTLKLLKR